MNLTKFALQEWDRLYDLMDEIIELKPWEWMVETDIFGVKNPASDEIGFVSIMGDLGQHFAIDVYRGDEGLDGFLYMQELGPELSPEIILQVPQLQASFEDRDYLSQEDRELIRKLGRTYRGQKAWPCFRSFRPSFHPWYLEDEERQYMIHLLEQTIDVVKRFHNDPTMLDDTKEDEYLVRVPEVAAGKVTWTDVYMEIIPDWPAPESAELTAESIQKFKRMTTAATSIEMDVFPSPAPIQSSKNQRPYYPMLLLMVDSESGVVLSNTLMEPLPSQEAIWKSLAQKIVDHLIKIELHPMILKVSSDFMEYLLAPPLSAVQMRAKYSKNLPALQEAKNWLLNQMKRNWER